MYEYFCVSLFRLCYSLNHAIIKPSTINFVFFQIPLTLSPVTGRRLDYAVFSVDIGVTGVTKSSRLYAVTSTTCSTLLLAVCVDAFCTHRHPAHHPPSVGADSSS